MYKIRLLLFVLITSLSSSYFFSFYKPAMASGDFSQDIGSESINEFHPEFESGQSKDFHPGFVPVSPRLFQDLPDNSTPGRRPNGTATQRSDSLNSTRNNQPNLEPRYGSDWQSSADCPTYDDYAPSPASKAGPYTSIDVPSGSDDASVQMERVVRADFSAWSGGNERLTMRQVGYLERMNDITGQQAAVLGLIGQFMVHQIKNDQGHEPAFNMEELLARLQALPKMRVHFLTAMKELAADTSLENKLSLYGQLGRPSMDGIHQAGIGDCFALSAIESVLNCRGPGFVESLIQETGYNQFLVSLPGSEPMTIKLTQAEIAQGNVDPGNGCWLQLLGIAIDRLKTEHRHVSRSKLKRIKDHQLTETPLGVLAVGGSQPMVFHWLTNDRYTLVRHRSETWNQNYVAGILNRASSQKIPLGVNTPDHCLSILGWNPDTQIVTVMNPWGTSGPYAPNGTEKFKMNDGVFSLSLDQLLQFFSSLSVPVQLCGAND